MPSLNLQILAKYFLLHLILQLCCMQMVSSCSEETIEHRLEGSYLLPQCLISNETYPINLVGEHFVVTFCRKFFRG